ncbi:hypothetical protein IQ16_01931 [Bradyrhizobium huanghuaihaiense]|uniref:Uncharacterized protein n=1 Tax=Bradyrhizobium huanghuaihaiense TaxID=990078 RepID=A0A562RXI6_9BRAD|nr:hypothetical protein [Bradyrhizobium huanghuaihaiense]TWI73787.1 hypothetical protein IQ16_01931 [Bradyrhizobium huanghuaihaiense]
MVDRIVQRISLEGSEDVVARLKKVGETGAKALAATNRTIEDSNSGLGKYGDVFASLNGKTEGSKQNIERVKRVVETIRPAAEKAGLELDGLGEFGKLGRGNIIALGAAITTTFVTAMEKAGDTARSQAQRLGAFTGSAQNGVAAYKELQKTAQELKVPTSTLTDPFEQITRTNERFGGKLSGGEQTSALKSLFTGAEADRVEDEKASPAIKSFLTGLREGGRLTPELTAGLGDIMPTLMKRLLQDLQTRLPNATVYSAPETLKSLGNILPQLEEDQRTTQTTFGTAISQSISHLKAEASNLGDSLNGTQIVSTAIEGAAKFLGATAQGIKAIKETANNAPAPDATLPIDQANRIRDRRGIGPVQGPQQYDFLRRPPSTTEEGPTIASRFFSWLSGLRAAPLSFPGEQLTNKIQGGEGDQIVAGNLDRTSKSAENLSSALDKTTESAAGAQQVFDRDRALNRDKAIDAASAKFTAAQARIDDKYKPEELDLQLGRDRLAVQNAALAKQSAQIGIKDAAKNKELADLAPEQAESAQRNAESRYSKALANLRRLQGYDTSAIDEVNPLRDARNELKDADTARKVADVNRRYAYLEPQKAELAQEKAQSEITSANYLARESNLKFTKDNEGRKLSSDVTSLRYMDAQLEEEKKLSSLTEKQVDVLQEILQSLSKERGSSYGKETGADDKLTDAATKLDDAGSKLTDAANALSTGATSTASGSTAKVSGRDLLSKDGVVNIPQGASQDEIDRAFAKQRAARSADVGQPNLASKEAFRADLDQSVEDLKADWKSQREMNAQLHNGSFESRTVGTQNSPMARTPSGVSQVYPPPVRGHYDENYQFVPDVPTYNGLGPGSIAGPGSTGASIPATNDYEFAGRKNPAGPYQEGISAPLSFPQYNKDRLQNLPSEYPDGVPLPQPRPPEAGPGQQSSLPSTQDVASLGSAFQSLIESISASINTAKGSTDTNPESKGIQGEGEQGSSQVSDLGDSVEKVDGALDELATSVGDAASNIEGKSEGEPTYAATGGLITGPGSTTSDSIPAMLSNKEFVVNADATQKHLGLLTALNAGKEIGFKHFAIGGPVGVMGDVGLPSVPSAPIASGGAPDLSDYGHVELGTQHGSFSVIAHRDVVKSMTSAARDAGVSQTGPRPGWYQGS